MDDATSALSSVIDLNVNTHTPLSKKCHVGVTKILPFCAPRNGGGHSHGSNANERDEAEAEAALDKYNCTISPSAIRVHTRGGMQVSQNDQIQGMVTGTFHPMAPSNIDMDMDMSSTMDMDINDAKTIASSATHVTVGGVAPTTDRLGYNLHCIDLYSNPLKPVASHAVRPDVSSSTSTSSSNQKLCISHLATHHATCNIIAGCSDGTLRIFDGRWRGGNYMECAKVRAHGGGVVQVATAGNLICTTGYSSTGRATRGDWNIRSMNVNVNASTPLYAFPDEHVLVFDIRFLGRGGIAHPFSGLKGGPRHISFIPTIGGDGGSSSSSGGDHRILVASGQAGGGLQVITPFESLSNTYASGDDANAHDFFNIPMDPGEAMTAMSVMGRDMALGTNYGNVHQYRMAGYEQVVAASSSSGGNTDGRATTSSFSSSPLSKNSALAPAWSPSKPSGATAPAWSPSTPNIGDSASSSDVKRSVNASKVVEKEDLFVPTYSDPPLLSIEPHLLRGRANFDAKCTSIFNAYNLLCDPVLTPTFTYTHHHGHHNEEGRGYEFNPYSFGRLSSDTLVPASKKILSKTLKKLVNATANEGDDFLTSIQTLDLDLNLTGTRTSTSTSTSTSATEKGSTAKHRGRDDGDFINVNMNKLLYGGSKIANIAYDTTDPRKKGRKGHGRDGHDKGIPKRYINRDRPANAMFTTYDFAKLNDTLFPGCDYPPVMQNSSVCSVLLLLYFIPEIRSAIVNCQRRGIILDGKTPLLSAELGFLFHQMYSTSINAMSHPRPSGMKEDYCRPMMGTFVPSNFLSAFSTMPEASALALLDDSPAAVETARRPEAFYRFLVHHLDKELSLFEALSRGKTNRVKNIKFTKGSSKLNLIDSLQGLNAVSMNSFPSGAGGPSMSSTRSYTVDLAYDAFVSRTESKLHKPEFGEVLQYSLCKDVRLRAWCDATKAYETVVQRKIVTSLPKILSLSCACAGIHGEERLPIWRNTPNSRAHWLPEFIEVTIQDDGNIITRQGTKDAGTEKIVWKEFKGEGLPSSVCNTLRQIAKKDITEETRHARYRLDIVLTHLNEEVNIGGEERSSGRHIVHCRILKEYKKQILTDQLENLRRCAVNTEVEEEKLSLLRDVTSEDFVKRAEFVQQQLEHLDDDTQEDEWVLFNGANVSSTSIDDALAFHVTFKEPCLLIYRQVESVGDFDPSFDSNVDIPASIWLDSPLRPDLPNEGDIVAFDAEFVQTQNEESVLTASGSKVVIREGRYAVGRISILDCKTGNVLIDDHVLPREPVVDFLTRFSGITASDLNPKTSRHHLISARNAYLKMRYLVDRGCKFVGHGLRQDFLILNLFVPPSQIIDTVDIYRLDNRRYISLRFLVNYLLGRDMQQEIHDSVEDSRAAYELYLKALDLKRQGVFDDVLRKIYEKGQQIDWKVAELKRPHRSRNNLATFLVSEK